MTASIAAFVFIVAVLLAMIWGQWRPAPDRLARCRELEKAGAEPGDYAREFVRAGLLELTDPGKSEEERDAAARAVAEGMSLLGVTGTKLVLESLNVEPTS